MSGQDPKRRFSRPDLPSGISAIFNPRKLRRNSTAVSQLLEQQQQQHQQHPPSVVVTAGDHSLGSFERDDYNLGSTSSLYTRMANGPPGPSSGNMGTYHSNISEGRRVHIGSAGSSTSASSVPLLNDVQLAHGSGTSGRGHGLITSASFEGQQAHVHYAPHSATNPSSNNNNNNNSAAAAGSSLKPITRTLSTIRHAIFSKTARKLCCGLFLSLVVGCCWTTMVHSIKRTFKATYVFQDSAESSLSNNNNNNGDQAGGGGRILNLHSLFGGGGNSKSGSSGTNSIGSSAPGSSANTPPHVSNVYDAPFFTAWLLTITTILFYPIHQITVRCCSCMGRKSTQNMSRAVTDAIQGFRERGMSLWEFLKRCGTLCFLWLITNWLFVSSLRTLRSTEVLALLSTSTSFVYLLSWVVLHQQFVGVRILAVILSNMGIALLAYMDGQTHKSPTVLYVVLGAAAACFSAVFKVSLKKFFGLGATVSQQVALIFSIMGLMSTLLLWPIFLTLYFTGIEVILWNYVPWHLIIMALVAFLVVELLENFGVTCTFEFFIKIAASLIAIPFSAVLDTYWYNASFDDMRLGGIITIGIGCCVVLFPENWPDYITRLIRYVAQLKHHSRWGRRRASSSQEPIDTRTGHIRSHLRSPSGRVR